MSFATLVFLFMALGVGQFIVIVVKTKKHRQFLDQFKASAYAHAMTQLAKIQPKDVFVIRACYTLYGVEVAVLAIAKELFY